MRQLVYTMFISNNCASFHLKEKLVKQREKSQNIMAMIVDNSINLMQIDMFRDNFISNLNIPLFLVKQVWLNFKQKDITYIFRILTRFK